MLDTCSPKCWVITAVTTTLPPVVVIVNTRRGFRILHEMLKKQSDFAFQQLKRLEGLSSSKKNKTKKTPRLWLQYLPSLEARPPGKIRFT